MNKNFYGDNVRWFVGKVTNVADPESAGRVQVRIYGIHSDDLIDVTDEDLPWAECLLPTTEGGVSGIGRMPQLKESAVVFGIFFDGVLSQAPLILGSIPHAESVTPSQAAMAAARGDTATVMRPDGSYVSSDARAAAQGAGSPGGANGMSQTGASYTPQDVARLRLAAFTFFVDNGLTAIAAAAICGNIQAESNFDSNALNNGRLPNGQIENSFGICQWNPHVGRRQAMEGYLTNVLRKPTNDFFGQLQYVLYELGITSAGNTQYMGGAYATQGTRIRNATVYNSGGRDYSNNNATWVWLDQYEIPRNRRSLLAQREQYAQEAYRDYMASRATATPTS